MRTKRFLRPALLVNSLLASVYGQAQVTIDNNFPPAGSYVGCDASITDPLEIRHDGNLPIEFYTNGLQRMQLWPNFSNAINGYAPTVQNGFLGLGDNPAFFNPLIPGAFSRLHLSDALTPGGAGVYAQQLGYRPWMRNGVTFTGNADQGYIGQKYLLNNMGNQVLDRSDMVLQWSNDRASAAGPDRLRFIFTTTPNGAPSGSQSFEGLEAMRMLPVTDSTANVGVGDFFAGNLVDPPNITEPTERLDVLNGRVRIRQLPLDQEAPELDRMLVVDDVDPNSTEFGIVKWRSISDVLAAGDCKWTMSAGPSPNHVYTAYSAADPDCPDENEAVGVGVDFSASTPVAKFQTETALFSTAGLFNNTTVGATNTGLRIDALGGATNTGVDIKVTQGTGNNKGVGITAIGTGGSLHNYGVRVDLTGTSKRTRGFSAATVGATYTAYAGEFLAYDDAQYTFGAIGRAYDGQDEGVGLLGETYADSKLNVGVWGRALIEGNQTYIGVRGDAPVNTNANSWAIWSEGDQYSSTGAAWSTSDAGLKTNIADVEGALARILQLHPKTYLYNTEEYGFMHLPLGPQLGLLAQELETVIPELVRTITRPSETDSMGNVVHPEVQFKALKYEGLIPLLVGAIQEQQGTIEAQSATNGSLTEQLEQLRQRADEQDARLALMQESLAACCAQGTAAPGARNLMNAENGANMPSAQERLLRIQPNPFNERTTVYYEVDRNSRTQLIANSADGKELRVLQEVTLEAGSYQYEWNTADLAPGMYYVTLLVDGQPLVKKAVKVAH